MRSAVIPIVARAVRHRSFAGSNVRLPYQRAKLAGLPRTVNSRRLDGDMRHRRCLYKPWFLPEALAGKFKQRGLVPAIVPAFFTLILTQFLPNWWSAF
jgi:hypothetical protein